MALTEYRALVLGTIALTVASTYIALYLVYQGYRGLRRHNSKPMRYLSVGMLLLFGVTYAVSLVGGLLFRFKMIPLVYQPAFRFVVRLLQLCGLAAVAYSVYLVRTREPTLRAEPEHTPDGTPSSGDGQSSEN